LDIVGKAGRSIAHKPLDLRVVVDSVGSQPFKERSDAHRAYFFGREINRWSEYRNAPVMAGMPTHHANSITRVNCMLIGADLDGHTIDELAHALLEAHWRDDADLDDKATLEQLAGASGFDGKALLERSYADDVAAQYQANTDEAIARSIFGSPTYLVDGDSFYGQDRLELVARALQKPFA
jgi:2-hydroxychromene-2-carboxylate isomerase